MMKVDDFVEKLIDVAKNHKTLYVMGCFGAPLTDENKSRYTQNHSYNMQTARKAMINAASADTFGFDCVCLIKGILWGWTGDKSKTYGGAAYASNGVPDVSADGMIGKCSGISTDFSSIEVGEAVWLSGHIGIYIGDGLAVECTPKWNNCAQITAVKNIGTKSGYNARTWTKHGKLPYIDYGSSTSTSASTSASALAVDGSIGPAAVKRLQSVLGTTADGVISGQSAASKKYWASLASGACKWNGGASSVVKALQKKVGATETGLLDQTTARRLQSYLISSGFNCGSSGIDGYFGASSAKALQKWLNSQK